MWRPVILLLLCANLWAQTPTSRPKAEPRIRTDRHGWPIGNVEKPAPVGARRAPAAGSDFTNPPATPLGAGRPRNKTEEPAQKTASSDGGNLRDLFAGVGTPEDLAELRCGVAWIRVKLLDHRGGVLSDFTIHHEFDLRQRRRDRLLFSSPDQGPGKIYGWDGGSVFAEVHGMPWTSLENQARQELERLGVLMRAPWVFADKEFTILGRDESYQWEGKPHTRIRIERRSKKDGRVKFGPVADPTASDRFDLIVPNGSAEPVAIQLRLAGQRSPKTVLLQNYQAFGRVRVPMKRVFLGPAGVRMMEMELSRLDLRQDLPASQFRPSR